MGRAVKGTAIALAGTAAAAVAILLFAALVAWRSLSPVSGDLVATELSAPVDVVRDGNAIAHIEATSHADAALALGFTHAQERMWQMEVLRRTAQGRLAEMFGEPAADTDVFLRTMGMARTAERSLAALKPETRAILEAYANGVNAYLNRELARLEPPLPPEFMIFSHRPEPWAPADSVAIMKLMSLQLSKNMSEELQRLVYAARGLNPAEIADLMPEHPEDRPAPLPDLRELLPIRADAVVKVDEVASLPVEPSLGRWASNNWVVSGERSATGKPLLANDPHLSFGAPSLWYLAHLSHEGLRGKVDVIGATLPGTPAVLLGRNAHVAWGFTNAGADVQDLFVERLRPADNNQYFTPEGWKNFDLREEVVEVSGGEDRSFTVRTGRHGPILPDLMPLPAKAKLRFSEILTPLHVVALNWTGLAGDDASVDALVGLNGSTTVSELRQAFAAIRSPMQAIVMADREGNIGLATPADVPVRSPDNAVQGRAPVPGWEPAYDWRGVIQAPDVPGVDDPPGGAIATANTRLPNADEIFLTRDWDEPTRLERAESLLAARGTHDVASMVAIQNDVRTEPFLRLRDRLLPTLEDDDDLAADLARWNGDMAADARAPLLMVAWLRALNRRIFADDLGDAFARFDEINIHALERVLNEGGARDWCDDAATAALETCEAAARAAWADATADLRMRFGEPDGWTWGAAHPVYGKHQPLGDVFPLGSLFNVERPAAGGSHTLNRGKTSFLDDDPYRSTHGAGYKAVYDLADLERSLFVVSTGQSGHLLSPQYRGQVNDWAAGRYLPMVTDPATYRKGALGTWTLTPARRTAGRRADRLPPRSSRARAPRSDPSIRAATR